MHTSLFRSPFRIGWSLILLWLPIAIIIVAPARGQLFESWTLSVSGQPVTANPDGSFSIPNIATPDRFGEGGPGTPSDGIGDDWLRVRGTAVIDGKTFFVRSQCFQVAQGGTFSFRAGDLVFSEAPFPTIESLHASPVAPTLTEVGQSTTLAVTARMSDGRTVPVEDTDSCNRTFRASNVNIARVDHAGVITAAAEGIAFITVSTEGATAVAQINVSGDPLTTVAGLVLGTDGSPLGGAEVSILELNLLATTGPDGRFMIPDVPTDLGAFRVLATATIGAETTKSISEVVTPVPSRISDAGIITIGEENVVVWTNVNGGAWETPSNWHTNSVPGPNDRAVIVRSGTYTVTLSSNVTVSGLTVGAPTGSQTLELVGATLSATRGVTNAGTMRLDGAVLNGTVVNRGSLSVLRDGNASGAPVAAISGSLVNEAGGQLVVVSGTINATFVNQGEATFWRSCAINGSLTQAGGSTLRIQGTDGNLGFLTISQGFTNLGLIEVTSASNSPNRTTLSVPNGTLTNGPTGEIRMSQGTNTSERFLTAQLDNQGTMNIDTVATINKTGAVHTNSGTLNVNAGGLTIANAQTFTNSGILDVNGGTLTISSVGTFTNTGTVTIGLERVINVLSSTLTLTGGSLTGGRIVLGASVLNLSADFTTATTALTVNTGSSINGPVVLTNAIGSQTSIVSLTINTAFVNEGEATFWRSCAINGSLTQAGGSTLRIQGTDGNLGFLTISQGFTNLGLIEVTSASNSPNRTTLSVPNGTLTNGPTGEIRMSQGTNTSERFLTAQLDNQGTMNIDTVATINKTGAVHTNSGTLNVNAGGLTIASAQTFTNSGLLNISGGNLGISSVQTFTNTGTVTIGIDRVISAQSSTLALSGGSLTGGRISLSASALNLSADFTTATTALTVNTGSSINGPVVLTNAVGSQTTIVSSTINTDFVNEGEATFWRSCAINGPLTQAVGAILRAQGDNAAHGILTIAEGFTNRGLIEVTSAHTGSGVTTLRVSNGTLTNAATGEIRVSLGTTNGGRFLTAQLDNQGTINIDAVATMNKTGAVHTNSGTLSVNVGGLTVAKAQTYTNSGQITVAPGLTMNINGGCCVMNGTVTGVVNCLLCP